MRLFPGRDSFLLFFGNLGQLEIAIVKELVIDSVAGFQFCNIDGSLIRLGREIHWRDLLGFESVSGFFCFRFVSLSCMFVCLLVLNWLEWWINSKLATDRNLSRYERKQKKFNFSVTLFLCLLFIYLFIYLFISIFLSVFLFSFFFFFLFFSFVCLFVCLFVVWRGLEFHAGGLFVCCVHRPRPLVALWVNWYPPRGWPRRPQMALKDTCMKRVVRK